MTPATDSPAAAGAGPANEPDDLPAGIDAPLFAILSTTRAMRRLSPEPMPQPLLRAVVEAAAWAPTAANGQGLSFVQVTDRAVIGELAAQWRRVTETYMAIGDATDTAPPIRTSSVPS